MRRNRIVGLSILGVAFLSLVGCGKKTPPASTTKKVQVDETKVTPLVQRVLTQEERDKLTPDDVITSLKEGNKRFMAGSLTARDHSKKVREAALGQFPKAIILSCVDSRIPVEDVFDRGIGDIFVARVAGNFANTDILGSMEFACKASGARLILVLGHEHCGAIQSAIDNVELGNITAMLKNIHPAIEQHKDYKGEKSGKNEEFVHMVAEENIRQTMNHIRTNSPILKQLEADGKIKIVGAMYNMEDGKVEFLR